MDEIKSPETVEAVDTSETIEEIQNTFNEDGLDVLVEGDDCKVENMEEVE